MCLSWSTIPFFWVEAAESAHQESADAAESSAQESAHQESADAAESSSQESAHQESADAAESAQETDMDSCVGPGCPSRHHVELEVINRVLEETMVALAPSLETRCISCAIE